MKNHEYNFFEFFLVNFVVKLKLGINCKFKIRILIENIDNMETC